ncbi:hypothetical protein N483_00130 [Pseudoalteromonas luteoviolacea NCIMB 1944]|nr:hypothetical protein N483_00130 [Pseudoalteromonas luteoviolacea NCIMB 1944]
MEQNSDQLFNLKIKKSRTRCGFLGVIRFVLGVSPKLCDYVTKELFKQRCNNTALN